MINIEYLICQYQEQDISIAISSHRNKNQNPAFEIIKSNNSFIWRFTGLQMGTIEEVAGEPRANRLDFYIGMDDLSIQIGNFPITNAQPIGLADGLRIPINQIRAGGKQINWIGPVSRVNVADITINIPPYKLKQNNDDDIILNVDREFSRYPITSHLGQTIREIHFGVEHNFSVTEDKRISIPKIEFTLNEDEYAEILASLNNSVQFHQNI